MMSTYKPGDHVLTFNWGEVKSGDVVVFKKDDMKYLKRVTRVKGDLIHVSGDNKKESAKMVPIKKSQIVGKIIFKY